MYGWRQVQAIRKVSKPLSGSQCGARLSSLSAPTYGFTLDKSSSFHPVGFYKVRSKISQLTTSWPLASSLKAQACGRLDVWRLLQSDEQRGQWKAANLVFILLLSVSAGHSNRQRSGKTVGQRLSWETQTCTYKLIKVCLSG